MLAYELLQKISNGNHDELIIETFEKTKKDLGYGLLLKRYTENVVDATKEQIDRAVKDSIPQVAPLFWTFRIMVACGFITLFVFIIAIISSSIRKCRTDWVLKLSLYTLPLPWIACETGWFCRRVWSSTLGCCGSITHFS